MDDIYYLESKVRSLDHPAMIVLDSKPMTLGRGADCTVPINSSSLSRRHASIEWRDGLPVIRDLDSTNGSFLNFQKIEQPVTLKVGDILHFAGIEYQLKQHTQNVAPIDDDLTKIPTLISTAHIPTKGREFLEMLEQGLVTGYRQSIVDRDGETQAYELLGRGCHPDLSPSPFVMFSIAQNLNKEVELSELLRRQSFAESASAGTTLPLFFNSHPAETLDPKRLLAELAKLRQTYPHLKLVFEVHEAAVTNMSMMQDIRAGLSDMDIGLAYDDFGAGQSRLKELTETPPDLIKFDISLVSGVTDPDSAPYRLLASLNAMVQDIGVKTLAEGVETEAEAEACKAIGIDYFQGYYFHRPSPILESSQP